MGGVHGQSPVHCSVYRRKRGGPAWEEDRRSLGLDISMLGKILVFGVLFTLTLLIANVACAADIEFVTQDLPWAVIDRPYSLGPLQVRSSGSCPLGGVGYAVVGGVLPPGVEMSKLGYFSGSPERTGVFGFAIRVSDGCTWVARRFTLTVTGAPVITISPQRLAFTGPGEKTVRVSASWPRLPYGVSTDAAWIRILPAHGFTPRPRLRIERGRGRDRRGSRRR